MFLEMITILCFQVSYILLDLGSFKSIQEFVKMFRDEHDRIDILVNNAGIISVYEENNSTEDGLNAIFGINHIGHFYLTKLLLPVLMESKARVINVSSMAHSGNEMTLDMMEGDNPSIIDPKLHYGNLGNSRIYCLSKLANVYFSQELVERYPELEAVSLHPGYVDTGLFRYNTDCLGKLIIGCTGCCMKTAEDGAKTTIHCCTINLDGLNGKYFKDEGVAEPSNYAKNRAVQKRLWEFSEETVDKITKKLENKDD